MSDEGDNYNCSLLKNSSKRAAFASQFAQAIHSRRVVWKPIPATLYRGVHLHQPKAAARRSMSFFTAHETEARTYAKHPPKQVHALRLGSNKWALDLTDNTTLQVLYNCLIGAGIPAPPAGELVKGSAALDIGANTHHEDVIFPLVKDYLFAYSVCALFRRTESSTLGRSAEEFGVYSARTLLRIPGPLRGLAVVLQAVARKEQRPSRIQLFISCSVCGLICCNSALQQRAQLVGPIGV